MQALCHYMPFIITLKGYAPQNIYPMIFEVFLLLTLESEMNYSHTNLLIHECFFHPNWSLHCLYRSQHWPLQFMLGIFGHKHDSLTMHAFITKELNNQPTKYTVTE